MTHIDMSRLITRPLAVLLLLAATSTHAAQTWEYTGNAFDTFFLGSLDVPGPITGSLTLATDLPADSALSTVTPTSFSFTDGGSGSWTEITAFSSFFELGTSGGQITQWNILV